MKMKIRLIAAVMCLLMGLSMFAGCASETYTYIDDEEAEVQNNTGWQVVSSTEGYFDNTEVVPEYTQEVKPDSSLPARKLMQVNFAKKYRAETTPLAKYYGEIEGDGEPYSGVDVIADDLTDALGTAILDNTHEAFVEQHSVGTKLSVDEFFEKVGDEARVDPAEIKDSSVGADVTAVLADVDNDGVDDITAMFYFGGTGGFGYFKIFKGTAEGFKATDSYQCVVYPFNILDWNGKRYLCQYQLDYETKYFYGYQLTVYREGMAAASSVVSREVDDYDVTIPFEDKSYEYISDVKKTLVDKNMPRILSANDDVIFGTAEEIVEKYYRFKCDINNDGTTEMYEKEMSYPSNMSGRKFCNWYYLDADGEPMDDPDDFIFELFEADGDTAENIFMFWADKLGDKNVLYMYSDSADRFVLTGYIFE